MKKGSILISLGIISLLAALAIFAYNQYEDYSAYNSSLEALNEIADAKKEIEKVSVSLNSEADNQFRIEDYKLYPEMVLAEVEIDGHYYVGTITIPSINVELPVLSEFTYPNLKLSPCRFVGTPYQKDMIICAHNYKKHFGGLKNVKIGDTVIFTDMELNEFIYEVTEIETLYTRDLDLLLDGDWDLTVFTCTIGGKQRVVLRCTDITDMVNGIGTVE